MGYVNLVTWLRGFMRIGPNSNAWKLCHLQRIDFSFKTKTSFFVKILMNNDKYHFLCDWSARKNKLTEFFIVMQQFKIMEVNNKMHISLWISIHMQHYFTWFSHEFYMIFTQILHDFHLNWTNKLSGRVHVKFTLNVHMKFVFSENFTWSSINMNFT